MTPFPTSTTSRPVPIDDLRATVHGEVITPDHAAFDAARKLRIGGIERRPGAIVRVADAADVARVVSFARERDLPLAVRSGGHSLAGLGVSDGGVTIDLARLNALEIDVAGRTAWAGTGLTTGEYTEKTGALGLATGFGDTGTVGIGGITLAGGIGYLVRRHGLAIDNLLAAEVVTADGEIRLVDENNEPDLFWAIRGGGGNVGVATRLRFRLHEVDTILGGMLVLPATPETVAGFVAEADAAPEELSSIAMVMQAPPMPFLPPEAHGRRILLALMAYAGDPAAGERAVAPFRQLAEPIADLLGPKRYPEMFPPEEDFRPTSAMHTMFTQRVDRDVAAAILDRIEASDAPMAGVQLRVLGGAMARVPADATAFAHRGAPILANIVAMYATPEERPAREAWVREVAGILDQGVPGAYTGFLTDTSEAAVRAAYPEATWARLAAVKARYDPTNLFRHTVNVPPATAGSEASDAA